MHLLNKFMEELNGAIMAHYTGEVGFERASRLHAMMGGGGVGKFEHVGIVARDDIVSVVSEYETGEMVRVRAQIKNKEPIDAWTRRRQYLLDPDHFLRPTMPPLEAKEVGHIPTLSPYEVRAVGPDTGDCTTFTHVQGRAYRVWRNGTVTCESKAGRKFSILMKGQFFTLPTQGTCYSGCWIAGLQGIKTESRKTGILPAAHPIMRVDVSGLEGSPRVEDWKKQGDGLDLEDIHRLLREDKDMIQDLDREENTWGDNGAHWLAWATLGGATLGLGMAGLIWCKFKKKARATHEEIEMGDSRLEGSMKQKLKSMYLMYLGSQLTTHDKSPCA